MKVFNRVCTLVLNTLGELLPIYTLYFTNRRGRKRKGRKVYFPRVKAGKRSASDERKYKKRKFDPGPTMILQEEVQNNHLVFIYLKLVARWRSHGGEK